MNGFIYANYFDGLTQGLALSNTVLVGSIQSLFFKIILGTDVVIFSCEDRQEKGGCRVKFYEAILCQWFFYAWELMSNGHLDE